MSTRIHPQACTTPKFCQEIKDSGLSERDAAEVFNITRATGAKWLKRDDVNDRSHPAHRLHTTFGSGGGRSRPASVALFVASRPAFHHTTVLNSAVSRSGIARLLERGGTARLEDVIPKRSAWCPRATRKQTARWSASMAASTSCCS
jgi:hypothetical protein